MASDFMIAPTGTVWLADGVGIAEDWRWRPYFSPRELACSCCGLVVITPEFLDKLVAIRVLCGFPFPVSSGYRCSSKDGAIGGKGPHQTGEAIDIRVYGVRARRLVQIAAAAGFNGFGIQQKGPHNARFIHLDTLDTARFSDHPRPYIWSY